MLSTSITFHKFKRILRNTINILDEYEVNTQSSSFKNIVCNCELWIE